MPTVCCSRHFITLLPFLLRSMARRMILKNFMFQMVVKGEQENGRILYSSREEGRWTSKGTIAFRLERQARFAAQQVEFASVIQAIKEVLRRQHEQFAASISQINTVTARSGDCTRTDKRDSGNPGRTSRKGHRTVQSRGTSIERSHSTEERHTKVTIKFVPNGTESAYKESKMKKAVAVDGSRP